MNHKIGHTRYIIAFHQGVFLMGILMVLMSSLELVAGSCLKMDIERFMDDVHFFPKHYLDADLYRDFFQKNNYFKERYYLESNIDITLNLYRYRENFFSVYKFIVQPTMGQTIGNIVFDPVEIGYGLLHYYEALFPGFIVQAGIDHRCFHEIDRNDYPTIYWNKPFFAIGSVNTKNIDFWKSACTSNQWTLQSRFSWYIKNGFYLKRFFGLIEEVMLDGSNPYLFETNTDVRFAFLRSKPAVFVLHSQYSFGIYKNLNSSSGQVGSYWRHDLSTELYFASTDYGSMLFLTFSLDDLPLYKSLNGQMLPRFSRDKLLQFGIRIFY